MLFEFRVVTCDNPATKLYPPWHRLVISRPAEWTDCNFGDRQMRQFRESALTPIGVSTLFLTTHHEPPQPPLTVRDSGVPTWTHSKLGDIGRARLPVVDLLLRGPGPVLCMHCDSLAGIKALRPFHVGQRGWHVHGLRTACRNPQRRPHATCHHDRLLPQLPQPTGDHRGPAAGVVQHQDAAVARRQVQVGRLDQLAVPHVVRQLGCCADGRQGRFAGW